MGECMGDKNGKPRDHIINNLTVEDSVLLRRLVDEHVPVGTSAEASLLISRLISNVCQRERTLGKFQERLDVMRSRALNAENIVRSLNGNDPDIRAGRARVIAAAVAGAKTHVRRSIWRWLRTRRITDESDVRNNLDSVTANLLAEAIEQCEDEET